MRAPSGALIRLDELADVGVEDGPAQISHEEGRRRVTVEMNVRGRDLGGFVADAKRTLESSDVIPAGYFTDWGGQFENLQEASRRLAIVVPLALALIFVMLFAANGSARLAAIIYLNVPFAVIGGVVALWARDIPFSISAGVGFIALFGVAVLNGLVLVSFARHLEERGVDHVTAIEQAADAKQEESHQHVKVCAQEMEAPDDRGSAGTLTHAPFAVAAPMALAFVPAPEFRPPAASHLVPPPTHVSLLASFGRLRL